jgi:hypothetical protein
LTGLRSAAHGFAVLETAGGFGVAEDLDASYERLIGRSSPGCAAGPGRPS